MKFRHSSNFWVFLFSSRIKYETKRENSTNFALYWCTCTFIEPYTKFMNSLALASLKEFGKKHLKKISLKWFHVIGIYFGSCSTSILLDIRHHFTSPFNLNVDNNTFCLLVHCKTWRISSISYILSLAAVRFAFPSKVGGRKQLNCSIVHPSSSACPLWFPELRTISSLTCCATSCIIVNLLELSSVGVSH